MNESIFLKHSLYVRPLLGKLLPVSGLILGINLSHFTREVSGPAGSLPRAQVGACLLLHGTDHALYNC